MKDEANYLISCILTLCNATSLADGNYNAGANTLAAMLTSLSNLSRPGSSIVDASGKNYAITCNLLVSGSLSSAIITDTITTSLARMQNNLHMHLARFHQNKSAHEASKQYTEKEYTPAPPANESEQTLEVLIQQRNLLQNQNTSYAQEWATVLKSPPFPSLSDMLAHQKIIVTANNCNCLKKQLTNLHLQSPLIISNINNNIFKDNTFDILHSIMSGTYSVQGSPEIIRGQCLISVSYTHLTLPTKA